MLCRWTEMLTALEVAATASGQVTVLTSAQLAVLEQRNDTTADSSSELDLNQAESIQVVNGTAFENADATTVFPYGAYLMRVTVVDARGLNSTVIMGALLKGTCRVCKGT